MDYRIEKGHQQRQPYVAILATVESGHIGDVMGPLYADLFGWLARKEVECVGEPWTRYLALGQADVEMEVGAPIAEPAESDGRIIAGQFPACDYARTLHTGPYEGLEAAYGAIAAWTQANGFMIAGAPWEVYLTDPAREPDPEMWQTMVYIPVIGAR